MMHPWPMGPDGSGWAVVLLVALVVGVAAFLAGRWVERTQSAGREPVPPAQSTARAILDRRLATGEIDEDDYLRRTAALDP